MNLKILIFDGSFKTTAFINRLAAGLAKRHQVYIAGFNEEMSVPVPGVHYIPLGSNQSKKRFVHTAFYWARKSSLKAVFIVIKALLKGNKKTIQKQNLKIALSYIQPDIIHLQWLSLIPWMEDEIKHKSYVICISFRGYQLNITPFIDKQNFKYLQKWFPKINGFHSVSKAISKRGDKIWTTPDKIDRVVYTGLPFGEWEFHTRYKKSKPLQLLSVGRTHWKKGYDYGLQVCRILKERNIDFQYAIIGGAGDEELEFMVYDLGLGDSVQLLDRMSLEEVKEAMRRASLMLLPSIEEGLPNVAVEAMAIGLPVVAFEIGGMPELIENGKEGWLVKSRDVVAMAKAVMEFEKMSMEAIENVRHAARKKVEKQHNEEQMVKGMEALYEEVLDVWSSRKDSRRV